MLEPLDFLVLLGHRGGSGWGELSSGGVGASFHLASTG
jgi:hypothetical protein